MSHEPDQERRLGLLSDTHGQAQRCQKAVERLREAGAQAFVHCGDVGDEAVIDALAGEQIWFVWGNTDFDRTRLTRYALDLGLTCLGDHGDFIFGGKRLHVTHGDDARWIRTLCERAERPEELEEVHMAPDYLLTGHTHVPHDRRCGRMRWINPGALHRSRPKTAALLDVVSGKLERLVID